MLVVVVVVVVRAQACSFLVTNFNASRPGDGALLQTANQHSRRRGPDATNLVYAPANGDQDPAVWTFLHNLLSLTGTFQTQPFVSPDQSVFAVLNGEIYNYQALSAELLLLQQQQQQQNQRTTTTAPFTSDGQAILPAYAAWGAADFVTHLHGEFAIVLVDQSAQLIILATDVFGTKPLWYATWPCTHTATSGGGSCFAAASYESALAALGAGPEHRTRAPANQVLVLSTKTGTTNAPQELARRPVFRFDLEQHKTSTADFTEALVQAVKIRTEGVLPQHQIFLGVSAGYDTGAIMLALQLLGRPFLGYYIPDEQWDPTGNEDESVVQARLDYCTHMTAMRIQTDPAEYRRQQQWLATHCESTRIVLGNDNNNSLVFQGGPHVGYSRIITEARKRNGLIFMSGVGVDEIMSMYSRQGQAIPGYEHVACPNATFPEDLRGFFPWCSFYQGAMIHQLMTVELTGGAHGIEARYPFLDPLVVQEFLWLRSDVKNAAYKKPVADFLRQHDFPNMWDKKAPMPFFFPNDVPLSMVDAPKDGEVLPHYSSWRSHSLLPPIISWVSALVLIVLLRIRVVRRRPQRRKNV